MKQFRITKDGWWALRDILTANQDFSSPTGNLWGESTQYVTTNYGRLPEPWLTWIRKDQERKTLQYIIYSYATPIAWRSNGIWTMPDVSYSISTTRHQTKVRTAIAEMAVAA